MSITPRNSPLYDFRSECDPVRAEGLGLMFALAGLPVK
jgi:hypothetical protein